MGSNLVMIFSVLNLFELPRVKKKVYGLDIQYCHKVTPPLLFLKFVYNCRTFCDVLKFSAAILNSSSDMIQLLNGNMVF